MTASNGKVTRIRKAAPGSSPLAQVGSTGLKAYGGRVYEEWLPELTGPRWYRAITEMTDQDPVIGSILFAVKMLLRKMDWKVNPYSDQPDDRAVGQFVEECLYDMSHSWEDTLTEILSFLPWGWSWLWQTYKLRGGDSEDPTRRSHFSDGLYGWRKWDIRAQDTLLKWQFDDDGGVQGLWQLAPPSFVITYLPIDQSLLFRTEAVKGNPEGRSILRNGYRPWYFGKNAENLEGIGMERDLAGLPTAFVPHTWLMNTATDAEKASLQVVKTLVTNVRRDEQEGVVFPMAWDDEGHQLFDFKLMASGGARQFNTSEIIQRWDARKAMVVLADFVLMGHEKVGSFALATSKTNIFSTAIGAWGDSIADVINEYAIPRLLRLNQFDTERRPLLTHGDIQGADLTEIAEYLQKLAQAGLMLFPNGPLSRRLLELANLPAPAEDEEDLEVGSAAQAETETPPGPGPEGGGTTVYNPKPYDQPPAGPATNAGGTASVAAGGRVGVALSEQQPAQPTQQELHFHFEKGMFQNVEGSHRFVLPENRIEVEKQDLQPIFNVPQAPAPEVKITNEFNPTVQPADVIMQPAPPRRAGKVRARKQPNGDVVVEEEPTT